MKTPLQLEERFGVARAQATALVAALVAAHGAADAHGFRPTDVRFFYYLFTNWLERDVLHPGEGLELTQVRRVLIRLIALGLARSPGARGAPRGRRARYALTSKGLSALAASLAASVDTRSFEEAVFVVTFVACYGPHVFQRLSAAESRRLRGELDARKLLGRTRRRFQRLLRDLDERVASSLSVAREAEDLRRRGASDRSIALELERLGAYQLQHVRSFATVVLSFPDDLRNFELRRGFLLRSRLLFETFAATARAQLRALDELDERLASADR
jgi:hypothetical protein